MSENGRTKNDAQAKRLRTAARKAEDKNRLAAEEAPLRVEMGRRFQWARIAAGYTSQATLARKMKVNTSRVGAWELGGMPNSIRLWALVCALLQVNPNYLLFGGTTGLSAEKLRGLANAAEGIHPHHVR